MGRDEVMERSGTCAVSVPLHDGRTTVAEQLSPGMEGVKHLTLKVCTVYSDIADTFSKKHSIITVWLT